MTLASEIMRTRVGTVKLTEDCAENIEILDGMGITLDLAGHTLSNVGNEYTIRNRGDLTIIDSVGGGTIYNSGRKKGCLINDGPGCVIINGGVFSMSARTKAQSWYCIVNIGKLITINDATVNGTSEHTAAIRNGFFDEDPNENIPKMIINGGTFTSQKIPVKNDSFGTLVVNGGTFSSPNECIIAWSMCTINGGTFTTSNNYTLFSGAWSEDGTTIVPGCRGGLYVNGGTFNGTEGIIKDLTDKYIPAKGGEIPLVFKGGRFNKTIDQKYLAPGMKLVLSDGMYVPSMFEWDVTSFEHMEIQHMRRMVIRAPRIQYEAGGIDLPSVGFIPLTVMGASAEGGITAYYNDSTKKLLLYRGGSEASGTVNDLTVVLIGNRCPYRPIGPGWPSPPVGQIVHMGGRGEQPIYSPYVYNPCRGIMSLGGAQQTDLPDGCGVWVGLK